MKYIDYGHRQIINHFTNKLIILLLNFSLGDVLT